MRHNFFALALSVMTLFAGCTLLKEPVKPDPQGISGSYQINDITLRGDVNTAAFEDFSSEVLINGIGVIQSHRDFDILWEGFSSERAMPKPDINFETHFVLFVYDTQHYNFCNLVGIQANQGILNPVIAASKTSLLLQDKAYVSLATLPKRGVVGVISGKEIIAITH